MGYKFSFTGKPGFDIVVVTSKGVKLGGIPKGVIIPTGYMREMNINDTVMRLCRENNINAFVAKHCDNECEITHLKAWGMVNRFGLYLTKDTTLDPDGDWTLDVCSGMGWLTRKHIDKMEDIVKYL